MPIKINGATSGSTTITAPATGGDESIELSTALASKASIVDAVPAGAVMHFAMVAAPTGWLKADGSNVSRSTYSDLFDAIGTTFGVGDGSTTFTLPDLRGEFVRGWSDGSSIDSGRTFGSGQIDAIQYHNHGLEVSGGGTANYRLVAGLNTDGNNTAFDSSDMIMRTSGYYGRWADETRPRNVALLACIKF